MKERPILFNGAMVRAILEGRKTQTRRVVKPQPNVVHALHDDASITTNCIFRSGDQRIHCPYGAPGDRLWVRETWAAPLTAFGAINHLRIASGELIMYAADDAAPLEGYSKWKPSIHMHRSCSRITLEVTDVRVERVQDISEADARAEGADAEFEIDVATFVRGSFDPATASTHYLGFKHLWDSINASRGYGWQVNPFCWVIEFKRVQL